MIKLNIGLTFAGNCEEAFNLYKSVFGGEFEFFIRFRDDSSTKENTPEKDWDKIAYVALPVGDDLLYGEDTLESSGERPLPGTITSVSVHPESKTEADRIFCDLSVDAKILFTLADFPWGYCGSLIDKFGVKWIIWQNEQKGSTSSLTDSKE